MQNKTPLLIIVTVLFLLFLSPGLAAGQCHRECCGNMSLSISALSGNTCTVTARVCATCCHGKSWQIRNETGTVLRSGTISGDNWCPTDPTWTVTPGRHIFKYFIGGIQHTSREVVCRQPAIYFEPSSFLFNEAQGGANPPNQTLTIWNSGPTGTTLNWSASSGASWLSLSPTSGTSSAETWSTPPTENNVTLSANVSGVSGGSHSTNITITDTNASNSPRTVPVTLNVGFNRPIITTSAATNVTGNSATLNANLSSLGYTSSTCPSCSTIVWFEYKLGTGGTWQKTCEQTRSSTGAFSCNVTGLNTNATYYFRAFAKNGGSW